MTDHSPDHAERARQMLADRGRFPSGKEVPFDVTLSLIAAALRGRDRVVEEQRAEILRLRGLLIDPGDPAWEDARSVLVAELRKAGHCLHADYVEAAHPTMVPSHIALNLIAHATRAALHDAKVMREEGNG